MVEGFARREWEGRFGMMEARSQSPNAIKLYGIVAALFDLDPHIVNDKTSQDSIETWDSMGTVSLIAELEAAFNIEFDLMELGEFRSVGDIRNVLASRGIAF